MRDSFTSQGMRVRSVFGHEQTEGRFACIEIGADPGFATPLHQHSREDEVMYIVRGTVRARVGAETRDYASGESVRMPRGVPHAWAVVGSEPALVLAMESPSGFERMLEELADPAGAAPSKGPDVTRLRARAPSYGIEVLAPASAWMAP